MPTISGTSSWYTAPNGWRVQTNVWNPLSLVYGTDYTISATYNANDVVNGTLWSWVFPARTETNYYNVHAYPELMYGYSPWWGTTTPAAGSVFPVAVANIVSLTGDYNLSFDGDALGYNIAFEMWLTDTPGGGSTTMTNEIMIWFHRGAFSPGGSALTGYADHYFAGTIYNQVNWTAGTDSQPWTYTAIVSNGDAATGKFDLANVLRTLQSLGIITGSEYLADLEFGAEVATGTGSFSIHSLSYAIQTGTGQSTVGGITVASGTNSYSGGAGLQTAVFSGARSGYTISRNGTAVTVTGSDGTHTLTGIEKAAFTDQTVILGRDAQAEDFSLDLASDILWQNTGSGQAAVWLMNGSGVTATALAGYNNDPNWHVIGAGDFDGDGKADILWQNAGGQAAIWLMNGIGVAATALAGVNNAAAWHVVGAGDFNGDGKADILWQNTATGQAAVWLMNGAGVTATSLAGYNNDPTWKVVGAGDFNGDGKADILWQNAATGQAAVWLMNGANVTATSLAGVNNDATWHVIGAGDFNGDGKADILWQKSTTGQAAVWLMNGASVTATSLAGANNDAAWHVAGCEDFNGDGKADILWQNATTGQAAVWLMNGASVISASYAGVNSDATWAVVAGSGG
jgi:hypothetical protein